MKLVKLTLIFTAAAMIVPLPVWAVIPATQGEIRNAPTNTSGTIERGGTITDINLEKKTIAVDGVTYPLAASAKVYVADVNANRHNLKKSMLIRFSTVKDIVGGKEKIIAIWIANPVNRPPQK